ncbi:hypothetical protein [Spectribacter hydrogenoxidans]|uniref:Uncharacterized protein n=1 Tax=Spectribacter hydrogenoxidans TaxID=3075608 RepID=A0ABU3C138_9GAMM|nr:hypothetical protein [Salinisphaera sp. W335]MDT0635076.1 hypothetical protein [Salinisphaera sp. W335]
MAMDYERSGFGLTHPSRPDVLVFFLQRAQAESGLSLDDFAVSLAFEYHQRVPAHAQAIDLELPDTTETYQDYAKAVGRLRKRVQRYVSGERYFPACLEEAWAAALPPAFAEECRRVLVRRYGFMAARAPEAEACADGEAVGRILQEVGELTEGLSRALADGHIGPEDFGPDSDLMTRIDDAAAAIASVRARAVAAAAEREARPAVKVAR